MIGGLSLTVLILTNLFLASSFSQLKGQDREQNENGRVDFAIPPLAVGVVVTQPSTFSGIPI